MHPNPLACLCFIASHHLRCWFHLVGLRGLAKVGISHRQLPDLPRIQNCPCGVFALSSAANFGSCWKQTIKSQATVVRF